MRNLRQQQLPSCTCRADAHTVARRRDPRRRARTDAPARLDPHDRPGRPRPGRSRPARPRPGRRRPQLTPRLDHARTPTSPPDRRELAAPIPLPRVRCMSGLNPPPPLPTRRNTELVLLVFAVLIVVAAEAAVEAARDGRFSSRLVTYAAVPHRRRRRHPPGHPQGGPLRRPAAAADRRAAQRARAGDDPPPRPRAEAAGRAVRQHLRRRPGARPRCCGPRSASRCSSR